MKILLYLGIYILGLINIGFVPSATIISETRSNFAIENIQVPTFLQELPSNLVFSNDTGSQLTCLAYGNSQVLINWIFKDGSVVNNVPGLRQILGNGTLYFPPFTGHFFRTDVHDTTYRCRVSYLHYTILSRDVRVRAIVRQSYEINVEKTEVVLGNTAFLRCYVSPHAREFVQVSSWYREKEMLLPGRSDIGTRYIVTSPNGDLCIRNVNLDDGQKHFSCVSVDTLTGERKTSVAVFLSMKEFIPNSAPLTTQKSVIEISTEKGNNIQLPCNVQGNPLPIFTWFRISDSGSLYTVPSSQRIIPSQSLLFIRNTDERDAGRWICKVSNQFGEVKLEIHLNINAELSVHIHPQVQFINSGSSATFNCSIIGSEVGKIEWFHNGKEIAENDRATNSHMRVSLLSATTLTIDHIGKQDQGMYQCIVSNSRSSAQASAELKLGETPPEQVYSFVEQNIRPSTHISLKCSASGSPPPQFTWMLDSQPILDVSSIHRYTMDQFVDISGHVTTHLNISHVHSDDGGLYKCVATNSMGSVSHMARLNVFGPPYVRAVGPIKAVAGESLKVHCPFSGYPIQKIRWTRGGNDIVSSAKYAVVDVKQGGYLKIHQVDSVHDKGSYTCIVVGQTGEEARRDLQVIVNSPPIIEPFYFPKNLKEGGRAQVTCSVSAGDMPVYFSWMKDNAAIPLNLQISEKKEEFFTLLILKEISAKHSGKYTCNAMNSAAKVNYTAELLVRVPPAWKTEPVDLSVILGNSISIHCDADGFPIPKITWFRGQGKVSKDFHSIPSKNNTLSVNYATSADEGYYMCEANNDIGNSLKKIIHVDVNEAVRFETPVKNMSSRRNDPVTLDCLALGDDPINIVWTHKNTRLDFNNYRISIVEMKVDSGVRSQLSISRSERYDSGKYVCSAENLYGTGEHVIYLAVQERPDPPSDLEVLEVGSRKIKLSWKRPYDGMSPVLSYLIQHQPLKLINTGTSSMITNWDNPFTVNLTLTSVIEVKNFDGSSRDQSFVGGLHPATTYLMRMLAINEIECSTFTNPIIIKTQEEAPVESPSNLKVKTGGMGELIITWQIPNKISWNGELLGYTLNCIEEKQNINYISTNNMTNLTITVHGWATTKTAITNLKKFTRYAIKIRTYNSISPGPWSALTFGTTLEDVPDAAPQNLTCTSLSSQSIKISWLEPPPQFHNGVLQGYKILYRPLMKKNEFLFPYEVKRTSNLETYLHALLKSTNYSIQVLAFTLSGDGMSSAPVFCDTEEDVPDPPANIKAAALTVDSILVSWLRPILTNGMITHYTVYSKESGRKGQSKNNIIRVDENGYPVSYESRGLIENQKYEFWVTASTSKGEGEPTSVVTQITNTRAPARIASFSQIIRVAVGSSLTLECIAVGNPTPRARWITRDRPVTFSPYYEVTPKGFLKIHSIEPNLSGNYTCSAKNLFGDDEIYYTLIALQTPNISQLSIQYASYDSIRVIWESTHDGGSEIQGYTLYFKTTGNVWSNFVISADQTAFTLHGLRCGTQHIIKMTAHNKVGIGAETEEMIIWTKGKAPQIPEEHDLMKTNSSCIGLFLNAWYNGGCPISHFSIEYRQLREMHWTVVSSDISGSEFNNENISFCDFTPATWYQLKLTANNDAGKTTAQFNFATTTINGERIPPPEYTPLESDNNNNEYTILTEEFNWFQSVIAVISIICIVFTLVIVAKFKRILCFSSVERYDTRTLPNEDNIKEECDNLRNQQVYSASPVKIIDKDDSSEMYEISPYATFNANSGRTSKGLSREITASALDYSMQFRTFGHPECDLNATAYPLLEGSGFGHVKGKSSWHKQNYYNTEDESSLNIASSSRIKGSKQVDNRIPPRSGNKTPAHHSNYSESDTSASPVNEFSNAPTFRVPTKSPRCQSMFHHESSTESIKELSPIRDHRTNTPRHVSNNDRTRPRHQIKSKDNQPLDVRPSSSSNR